MAATVEIVIKTIDESTKQTKKISDSLKDLGKGIVKGTAAVVGFGFAAKKAFDLAEQAANMRQLAAAGEALGVDLESLRKASNNTVSDFGLLAATQTLLIGTSGDLKEAFLDNSDQLLAIAKAANRLNPTLGSTTFLYESLARGIKRSSPLILDNLGLVVKIGDANEKYAKSLGKTVGELTAEEKQMALLNATLKAGNVLIEQSAQVADEGADAFAQITAGVQNYTLALAKGAGQEGGFLSGIDKFVKSLQREAEVRNEVNRLLREGLITQQQVDDIQRGIIPMQTDALEILIKTTLEKERSIKASDDALIAMEKEFVAMRDGTDAAGELTDEMNDLAMAEGNVSDKAQGAKQSMLEFFNAADPSKLSDFQKNLENLDFARAGGGKIQQFGEDLEDAIEAGAVGMREITKASEAGFVATQALNAELGNTSVWEAAAAVAKQLEIGPGEALRLVKDLDGALNALDDVDLTITINRVFADGQLKPGAARGSTVGAVGGGEFLSVKEAFATGGSFLVPGSGGTDSQFVGFMATPGEKVSVDTPGQQKDSEAVTTITNVFPGTVHISSNDTELLMTMGLDVSGARVP
jgi:hypothetical protein